VTDETTTPQPPPAPQPPPGPGTPPDDDPNTGEKYDGGEIPPAEEPAE